MVDEKINSSWRKELNHKITTLNQLEKYITFTSKDRKRLERVISKHPISFGRYYMSLIDKNAPDDPIKKGFPQYLLLFR